MPNIICISKKLPGGARAAGLGTALGESVAPDISRCSKMQSIKWRNMPAASEGYAASKTAVPGRGEAQKPDNYRARFRQCYGIPRCSPSVLGRVT